MKKHEKEESYDKTASWTKILKTKFFKDQISQIVYEYPGRRSFYIDYKEVQKHGRIGIELADEIIQNPGKVKEDIIDAINSSNLMILPMEKNKIEEGEDINIRFNNLPRKTKIRDIRDKHINTLVCFDVIVSRASDVRPCLTLGCFRCSIGHFTLLKQKFTKYIEPESCDTSGCTSKRFDLLPKRSQFMNKQKIKVQESGEGLKSGQQPQDIEVWATDDLCDQLNPGDRLSITGIIRSQQRIIRGEKSQIFDLFMELSSIEREEDDFEDIGIDSETEEKIKEIANRGNVIERMIQSLAPSIHGMTEIKKAIILQLFSGVYKENPDGTTGRPSIHILILGDPGIAKSMLVRYITKICPRGIYVNMRSSSGPGLIGTVSKDEDRWVIEAGALSYADMGIAAIDELDKADDEGREALYEVMQDGVITINKASIHRTLKARCSLLAAANPKGERFDLYGDISDQVNMKPAFLSRFDLIFMIPDKPDKKDDTEKAEHILRTQYIGQCRASNRLKEVSEDELNKVVPEFPPQFLKQYIHYSQKNVSPVMTKEARDRLQEYYIKTRGEADEGKPVPITARALESTVRLAEAITRANLEKNITLKNANEAIQIFDSCIRQVATDRKTGYLDAGRLGNGISQSKMNLLNAIRKEVSAEPGISHALLLSKLADHKLPNGTPDPILDINSINIAIDELKKKEMFEPKIGHYRMV